jgi:predicted aminopeptidase
VNALRGKPYFGRVIAAIALCATTLSGCEVAYLARSACTEVRLLWNRRPISAVLKKDDLNPEVRAKLELVLKVRSFASHQLGLNVGGAYASVTPVDRSAITWVLMAAEPDRLSPYTWYFPIVGSVPYKGYFNKAAAQAAAAALEAEGLDTFIRPAIAFSSLGYFNDPLLSNLLGLDRVVLAGVLIHELFHRTYFLASNAMFDESAANYVGSRGAILFFDHLKGANSEEAAAARSVLASDMKFGDFLEREERRLLDLYYKDLPRAEILKRRVPIFHQIQANYTKLKPQLSGLERFDLDKIKLNNAVLINYQLYFHNLEDFAALDAMHQCDLRTSIESIISLAKGSPDDPFGAIRHAVESVPHPQSGCVNAPTIAPPENPPAPP